MGTNWGNYGWYPILSAINWNNAGHEGPQIVHAPTGDVAIEINFVVTTQLQSFTHDRQNFNSAPPVDQNQVWLANRVSITISSGQMTPGRYVRTDGIPVNDDAYYYGPNVHELGHALGIGHPTNSAISGPNGCTGNIASSMHGSLSFAAYCNWFQPQGPDVTALNGVYK